MPHLTVAEAAKALSLSVPTVKRYIYDGTLRSTKLPGGQHRIPEEEIARLLSGAAPDGPVVRPAGDVPVEQRAEVLERWVEELQAEVDRLGAALEVMVHYVARHAAMEEAPPAAAEGPPDHRHVVVLGPGCRRCDALYDLTLRVLMSLGDEESELERVSDLDGITSFGPILTPALIVDDAIVSSGRVPSEAALRRLLGRAPIG